MSGLLPAAAPCRGVHAPALLNVFRFTSAPAWISISTADGSARNAADDRLTATLRSSLPNDARRHSAGSCDWTDPADVKGQYTMVTGRIGRE